MGKTTPVRAHDPDLPPVEHRGAHFVKFGEFSPNALIWLSPIKRGHATAGYFVTNRAGYSLGAGGRKLVTQEALEKALATERPTPRA